MNPQHGLDPNGEGTAEPVKRSARTALIVAAIVVGVLFVIPAAIFVGSLAWLAVALSNTSSQNTLMGWIIWVVFSLVPIGYGLWAYRYIKHRDAKSETEPVTGLTVFLVVLLSLLITSSILVVSCFGLLGWFNL